MPEVLTAVQLGRCRAYVVELAKMLEGAEKYDLQEAQWLEQKLSQFLTIVRHNINRVIQPSNDRPGYSNDTHGATSRMNPES